MGWDFKLTNARSYTGAIVATVKNPVVTVEDKQLADYIKKLPYFVPQGGTNPETEEPNEKPAENEGSAEPAEGDSDFTMSGLKALKKPGQEDLIIQLGGDPSTAANEEERIALIQELAKNQEEEA
ncbi:hypothetical protein MHH67_11265 [Bacillus sp. FSL K6-0047]|uniref:hypothetical protein n=1 Tax=Shouchella clausii TaxID=79880 RepID=UPI0028A01125|nr:hypothetical protein [Shouchella clausii]